MGKPVVGADTSLRGSRREGLIPCGCVCGGVRGPSVEEGHAGLDGAAVRRYRRVSARAIVARRVVPADATVSGVPRDGWSHVT